MQTKFIPIDYDAFDYEGKNYVKIVGRDEKGKRICVIDSCPIYFWAILDDNLNKQKIDGLLEKIRKIQLDIKGRKTKVEKAELHNKKFLGKKVKAIKIFITNYKDAHEVANQLGMPEIVKRRGYDLGYITHYIIEKKINPLNWYEISGKVLYNSTEFGGIDTILDVDLCLKLIKVKKTTQQKFLPKVLAYDIEADELELGKGEILMISLVSNNFKKVITWKKGKISNKENEIMNKQILGGRDSASKEGRHSTKTWPQYVEFVKDEAELLEKFCKYIKKISPDFLVGYFSDGFDLPYIKARAEKHNIKLKIGIDGSQPKFRRGINLTGKINGIIHIDILKFIRTAYAQYMKSETLSLNEVAKEFLGDTKKPFTIQHSSLLDDKSWKKYYEYNLHDSVLTYQLFEKFWPDLLEFTKITQEPIFDISRAGLSKYMESYVLHNLKKFNEIPEKHPTHDEIGQRKRSGGVEGAFVLEPKPGLYENITMFDFTSMHTSIIISHNISRETLLDKKQKNSYESPELEFNGKKTRFYFSKEMGFFPSLLKEIFQKRKRFKAAYKKNPNVITKARSNAFKVLSASAHGYIGFFGARYYSLESSASILAFVRQFNKEAIKKTEQAGYKTIYGDTDSIAFLRGKKSKKEVQRFLKKLNSQLPGVMALELDGFFKRGLWVTTRAGTAGAKKKYAMLDEKGNIKIRGFETVRRDWCALAREVQNKVINYILKYGNEKRALEYVKSIVKKLKNREIHKQALIIRTQLKKPISEYKAITPHVIAAKKMQEKEIPVSQGNLIEYFIAETREKKKLVRDKVKLTEEKGEYNIKYYLERQILPAIENIFQVFNINAKEIINGKKQMTLGEF